MTAAALCSLLSLLLAAGCEPALGLSLGSARTEKMLEGDTWQQPQSSGRVRRQAEPRFIPLRFYSEQNSAPDSDYPRVAVDKELDAASMFRYRGVPASPQRSRLRGDLRNMNPNEGRVELEFSSSWGLACDNYFGKQEADVYCRDLGFRKGSNKPYLSSFFGTGKYLRRDIIIGNVQCKGFSNEKNLFQCNHNLMPPCSLTSTAGVQCRYNDGCDWGWSAFDGVCYRVETEPATVAEAIDKCREKGATLAFINSAEENNFITNMLYTKFKGVSAAWTGGQFAMFRDLETYESWTFKDTIHLIRDTNFWFPGFPGSSSSRRPTADARNRSCIALSRIFYKPDERKDVDVNYFWWDNVSCRSRLAYVCQRLGTTTPDCYSGNGESYRGQAQRTDKGTPCQPWTDNPLINPRTHPDKGLGSHRECRNPDGDAKPWCWVDNQQLVFGYCSLRQCGSGGGGDGDGDGGRPQNLSPGFNSSRCDNSTQFFCPSMINYRPICVEQKEVCNGHKDCVGGEDEASDFCKKYKCESSQFYCRQTHKCIPKSRVCDKYYDCDHGDDETPEACELYKPDDTEAEILKTYDKKSGVNDSAIPASIRQLQFYSLSLAQCKSQCETTSSMVCRNFVYNRNDTRYLTPKCVLLGDKLPAAVQDAGGPADYYERKEDCSGAYFKCNNTKCAATVKLCDGYDDCGDFSDEIGPKDCPAPRPTFSVRLNGGKGPHEGRIEAKLFNEWGLVCDDGLDDKLAAVVCKQLGFNNGVERFSKNSRKEFGRGSGKFLMGSVSCTGSESSLYDCRHSGWHNTTCSISNVAGLVCLQLRPCTNKEFRCPDRCVPLTDVCNGVRQCSGGEDEQDCERAEWALQLRNGANSSSGVVEITRGGISGSVCDDTFGLNEAKVVCSQLRIAGRAAKAPAGAFRPPAGSVMWLQDVTCTGSEASLFDCRTSAWGNAFCDVSESVGVVCGLPDLPTTLPPATVPATTAGATQPPPSDSCGQRIGRFPAGRIINGYPAIVGQFPWQVGIRLRRSAEISQQWCGGTVVNDRWIVTAAHCFEYSKSYYILRIGDVDNTKKEEFEREFEIDLLILHPQYSGKPFFDYDLTLIRIKPDSKGYLQFNQGIQPACLPAADLDVPGGTVCHVSGWGSVGDYELPDNLMAANVPLIDRSRCNQMYPGRITERMQCAGFEAGGIDSCQGDSGGPLVCKVNDRYTLIGATSWGEGCAVPGSPGVYANVRNLRAWIDETIGKNS